jgi:hypothetical protein
MPLFMPPATTQSVLSLERQRVSACNLWQHLPIGS